MIKPYSSQEEMQKDFEYMLEQVIKYVYPHSWSQQLWHLQIWVRHIDRKITKTIEERKEKGLNVI